MKFDKKPLEEVPIDMTPMIDMVFQLLIFFMLLINFEQGEQHAAIQLPASVLARPPEEPPAFPIVLHVTKEGNVIYGGREIPVEGMGIYLRRERELLQSLGKEDATVIIRAHQLALTGRVQQLVKVCQDKANGGFEQFVLRVKEEVKGN